ncbi:MAG: methyl-accepting chemotaxis protein [Intestinimonas sp.]|jgi:methyl-accepting chemotaxis protein|nr:methyl-accepting chemotaxis protein [Intestinimonas sp.]
MKNNIKQRKRGIKKKLVSFTLICIVCIILVLTIGSVYLTYDSTRQSLVKSLTETTQLVSEKITEQLNEYSIVSQSVARYVSSTTQDSSIKSFLNQTCSQYGLNSIDIIAANGDSIFDGKSYQQDNAYLQAKSGEAFLTDPIINSDEQTVSFEYAYPYHDVVVMINFPYSILENIIKDTQIGNTGSTYILNHEGAKVAHTDFSLVLEQQNNLVDVKSDSKTYADVAKVETAMVNGETGFGFYTWKGDKKFGSYAPIDGTNGWSVDVTALESEFMSGVKSAVIVSVILGVAALLISIFAILKIANRIVKPIHDVVDAIEQLSSGDLNIDINIKQHDEIGMIAERINGMGAKFKYIISDISRFLSELSNGNLNVHSECEYPGEFDDVQKSMGLIADSLNDVITTISTSADQVNSGAGQVSGASQALASGAAEQAATVEELNASVTTVSSQAEKNAESVRKATTFVDQAVKGVMAGNTHMQNLNAAMDEISTASQKISSITKVIEDIAFQTNILALNAAVEAARAGSAGKGFAVVADEVRNLAAKSAEAAKQTTDLIQNSTDTVATGGKLAVETAQTLQDVAEKAKLVDQVIHEIESASSEQAQAIDQIMQGLSQVSSVVQSNAATAEESSASSEELAAQAQTLQQEVRKFKLRASTENAGDNFTPSSKDSNFEADPDQEAQPAALSAAGDSGKY